MKIKKINNKISKNYSHTKYQNFPNQKIEKTIHPPKEDKIKMKAQLQLMSVLIMSLIFHLKKIKPNLLGNKELVIMEYNSSSSNNNSSKKKDKILYLKGYLIMN